MPFWQVDRLHSENSANLVRKHYVSGTKVAFPPTNMCEALRPFQPGLALPQLILSPLALGDIAHQAQKPTSALVKLADANLHWEGGAVLAPVAGLESDGFPRDDALLQTLDGRIIEACVEIASMFANQLFPALAQTIAGLAVDIENGRKIVKQKEGVSRVIHERAESRLIRAQLGH